VTLNLPQAGAMELPGQLPDDNFDEMGPVSPDLMTQESFMPSAASTMSNDLFSRGIEDNGATRDNGRNTPTKGAVGKRGINMDETVLDRHAMFGFIVAPSIEKASPKKSPPGQATLAHAGRSMATNSSKFLVSSGSSMALTHGMATSSTQSTRLSRSCGVAVRHGNLPRQDTIPCRITGKRFNCAQDSRIRIFVKLPGNGRVALWVSPSTPVGPIIRKRSNPYERFPEDRPSDTNGRLTPLRSLLTEQMGPMTDEFDSTVLSWLPEEGTKGSFLRSTSYSSTLQPEDSLKGLLEAATGVPVAEQKLVFGRVGALDDDERFICEYDVGHGALIYLSVKPSKASPRKDGPKFLATAALAAERNPRALLDRVARFVKEGKGSKNGMEIVEHLPDWQKKKADCMEVKVEWPHEQPYHDYMSLPDNNIFDLTGRVRKRFQEIPQTARFMSTFRNAEGPRTAR